MPEQPTFKNGLLNRNEMKAKEQLTVALVQFDIVWKSVDENLDKIEKLISGCKSVIDLIVLPEAFNAGFSTNSETVAEETNGRTVQWMKELSTRYDCAVCGSLFVKEEAHFYNRFFWVEPNGNYSTYDKRHLFSMGGEDHLFSKGERRLIVDYKGWRIFPQICYDLRFPVWCRNVDSYDLMINVANWPASRSEVWKTLLKARAIENQCYVVAVNRVGVDGNAIEYSGDSLVVDPKGIKIFKAHHREMIETVTLDYSNLLNFRKKFNTLKDGDQFILKG
jgi:predicted amidohydrolase